MLLSLVLQSFLFIIAIVCLYYSSLLFIHGAIQIAYYFHLSELVIGLTLVAIGTSTPEMIVSILASLNHHSDIAISNVIGSNIFNSTFLLGFAAVILPVPITKSSVYRDGFLLWIMTSIFVIIAFAFASNSGFHTFFWEGVFFLIILLAYLAYLGKTRQVPSSKENTFESKSPLKIIIRTLVLYSLYFLFGLASLLASSSLLIYSAKNIAHIFHWSDWIIGSTITALGTSAPELFSVLACSLKKQSDMAAGTVLGSNVFNLLAVLGVVSLLKPHTNFSLSSKPTLVLLWSITTVIIIFMRTNWKISRIEGWLLLSTGSLYWLFSFI